MREVIGHTRRGSEIWISLEWRQGVAVVEELASFSEIDEEFDSICAIEAFAVRPGRREFAEKSVSSLGRLLEKLEDKLGVAQSKEILDNPLNEKGASSTERVRYGKQLLRPEYRW